MEKKEQSEFDAVLEEMAKLKPKAGPCSPDCRVIMIDHILPPLKDQALSELRRKNGFPPRLIGFMEDGEMGIVDVVKAMDREFGEVGTKDATAAIHRIGAMLPGVYASVFCAETWMILNGADWDKTKSLADHPDRVEGMMFNMLHYDWDSNTMMQLMVSVVINKVLGENTSPSAWRHTDYGETMILDVNEDQHKGTTGRFIYGG